MTFQDITKSVKLMSAFVGGIVRFGLGFLIYGLLLGEFMKANMTADAFRATSSCPRVGT